MKIALFVSGQKGLSVIQSIPSEFKSSVETVIIGTDKSIANDYSEALTSLCSEKGLNHTFDDSTNTDCDYLFAIGWRKLIPLQSNETLIVLHDSILPKYRGFNPLVTALINGDKEIGVTAIFGEESYDTGAIIDVEKLTVTYPIKIAEAISIISECYSTLFNRVLKNIFENSITSVSQNESDATYSLWRDKEDYRINWQWSSERIQRMIHAVSEPYDSAKAVVNGKMYRIVDCTVVPDVVIEYRDVGKVIFKVEEKPVVVCGEGLLRLDLILNEDGMVEKFTNQFRLRFS
ncbi:methionyl-tRNA formyltransferase [Ulvibacter sp. MAR_2010_11]|uniref:methionyl-tRNA formyltransferase n=1 Tax=Ulvibacter sp. MAR_2010_11 TaxID=1250229 RepID=UPI000C2B9299|nr:formyltransferase family protein [Ulvibacter sp. MAR_2010_11]PKA82112.1 methionyl-tRNA formyltransferase [Ulvibacter sp. MAR_2010_11]